MTKKISGTDDSVASATVVLGIPDATHDLEVTRFATKSLLSISSGSLPSDTVVTTSDATFAYKLGASGQTVNVAVQCQHDADPIG